MTNQGLMAPMLHIMHQNLLSLPSLQCIGTKLDRQIADSLMNMLGTPNLLILSKVQNRRSEYIASPMPREC